MPPRCNPVDLLHQRFERLHPLFRRDSAGDIVIPFIEQDRSRSVGQHNAIGEMQDIVRTDGGVVIPMFASYVMAHSDKVKTPDVVGANWTLDGFRALERWWFG